MAWLDLNVLLIQLLPQKMGPFTLAEITEALRDAYGRKINYNKVYYSFQTLSENEHLKVQVQPLNPGKTPLLFPAEAAWRICRHVVRGKLPPKMQKNQAESKPNPHQSQKR